LFWAQFGIFLSHVWGISNVAEDLLNAVR